MLYFARFAFFPSGFDGAPERETFLCCESGLFENEPTAAAEQAHTTRRQ